MSKKNINSFSQNMNALTTNSANTLAMLEAQQRSLTTNDTFVTFDYKTPDGEVMKYQLPSYDSLVNRIKALEESINSLNSGYGAVNLEDGSRRTITLTSIPHTPEQITGLDDPSTFKVDSNWFFEDLMFPGAQVSIDLTGKIEDTADRVRVTRIILNSSDTASANIWEQTLSSWSGGYVELKSLLSDLGISYYEDEETINLPLVSNQTAGEFRVTDDPIMQNGNVWYTLDTLSYSTISNDGVEQGQNNILSVGDRISYSESIFEITEIDLNAMQVRFKRVSGVQQPGMYSVLKYYEDPFRNKTVNIRFGAHEYNIIYFKGVAENFNLLADQWSTPVKFSSDDLILDGTYGLNEQSFQEYYSSYIIDWGARMISEARDRKITAWDGHEPNAPQLNTDDFRVVQINTQINAAVDTTDVKNTAAEIESVKSQIASLKSTIAAQKTDLQSADDLYRYNAIQQQIATNIVDLNSLQTTYSTLVDSFLTIVKENSAVTTEPKYHIRGFFPIPEYRYSDGSTGGRVEEIIGFDIAYRYIKEDGTATLLNTFSYTAGDGTEYTGTFTDWVIEQGPVKTKIRNTETGLSEWKAENIADGTETNINQIDIAISKGEKVEIKVRSISEAGYPDNPLRSDWSNSIVMEFPSTLATGNEIADLIQKVNDDALTLTIQNTLDSIGVGTHLDDTTPNSNSVNGIYFKHMAKYIAYEEEGVSEAGTTIVNTISLQDKIDKIAGSIDSVVETANDVAAKIEDISVRATDKHDQYDADISTLKENVSLIAGELRDTSADLHAFVTLNRDDKNEAHPVLAAKRYIVTDDENQPISSFVVDNGTLKLSDNANGVSDLIVKDIYTGNKETQNSVKTRLANIESSLGTKALNASVVQLDSSLRTAYTQIANVSAGVANNSTNISNIRGIVNEFWNDNLKIVQLKALSFDNNDGVKTYVRTNANNGTLELRTGSNGTGSLGELYVNDVHIGEGRETYTLTSKVAELDSVKNEVGSIQDAISDVGGKVDSILSGGNTADINCSLGNFKELETGPITASKLKMSENEFAPVTAQDDSKLVVGKFSDIEIYPTGATTQSAQYGLVESFQKYDTFIDNYQDWLSSAADAGGHIQFGTTSEMTIDHIICSNVDVPGTLRIGKTDSTGSLGEQYAQFDYTGNIVKLYSTSMSVDETTLQVDDVQIKIRDQYTSLRELLSGDSVDTLVAKVVEAICDLEHPDALNMLIGALTRVMP